MEKYHKRNFRLSIILMKHVLNPPRLKKRKIPSGCGLVELPWSHEAIMATKMCWNFFYTALQAHTIIKVNSKRWNSTTGKCYFFNIAFMIVPLEWSRAANLKNSDSRMLITLPELTSTINLSRNKAAEASIPPKARVIRAEYLKDFIGCIPWRLILTAA